MFFLENDYLLEEVEPTNMGLDGLEGAFILHAECDEMWYNLREKMMKLEHTAIVTENADLLLEGKSSFVENVKKLLQRMKQAVEELFRKFMEWVSRLFNNDKKLVERLKEKGVLQQATIKGFAYTNLVAFGDRLMNARDMVTRATQKMKDFKGQKPITEVAKMLGISGSITSDSELVSAIKEHIQGAKERSEVTIKRADAGKILAKAKDEIARAEKVKKSLQAALDSTIKGMEANGKVDIHADEVEKYASGKKDETIKKASAKSSDSLAKQVSIAKEISRSLITGYGAYISGLKDRRSQYRAAASKMINKTAKPEEKASEKEVKTNNESFTGILGLF